MSFGIGVGDVFAVLGLIEKVAGEIKNYRSAPRHFQQLQAELDLLHSTIQYVLRIDPSTPEEDKALDLIRAVALHCNQPLRPSSSSCEATRESWGTTAYPLASALLARDCTGP